MFIKSLLGLSPGHFQNLIKKVANSAPLRLAKQHKMSSGLSELPSKLSIFYAVKNGNHTYVFVAPNPDQLVLGFESRSGAVPILRVVQADYTVPTIAYNRVNLFRPKISRTKSTLLTRFVTDVDRHKPVFEFFDSQSI